MACIVERRKVSVPYLAKEWGIATNKITAWIKSGELKAINVATSRDQRPRYLIDRADIEAFERARLVVPEQPPRPRRTRQTEVKDYFA
jgi:hypothetical protein